MNRRVAIAGVALSDIGRVDDLTPYHLHAQAVRRAVADAGLTKDDVDGFASNGTGTLPPIEVAEYLGLKPSWIDSTGVGGGTWEVMAAHAVDAIAAGHADVVVLSYGSTTRADLKKGRRTANLSFGARGPIQYEVPYGHTLIAKYGMATNRHRHEYGTTMEQLAEIAVSHRYNAGFNPDAYYRDPITIDDVQSGRMIADPFTKLHCCIRSDGGCAVVLVAEDRVADLRTEPVWVLGSGQAASHTTMSRVGGLHRRPGRRLRRRRLRPSRGEPRRHRPVLHLRRLHLHGARDARGPGLLRQGRGRPVRVRRQAAPGRGAAHQPRRWRALGLPPGHARPVPAGGGHPPAARRVRGHRLRRAPGGRRRLACVSGTGGWFCANGTMILGKN